MWWILEGKKKSSLFESKHLPLLGLFAKCMAIKILDTLHEALFSSLGTYHVGKLAINSFISSMSSAQASIETYFFLLILLDIFYLPKT